MSALVPSSGRLAWRAPSGGWPLARTASGLRFRRRPKERPTRASRCWTSPLDARSTRGSSGMVAVGCTSARMARRLAALGCCKRGSTVEVLDAGSGSNVFRPARPGQATTIAFSPDGRYWDRRERREGRALGRRRRHAGGARVPSGNGRRELDLFLTERLPARGNLRRRDRDALGSGVPRAHGRAFRCRRG